MPVPDHAPPLSEREALGLKLRAQRKRASLTTAQAAELGGVSVTQLGAIERGTHPLTSMSAGNLSRLPAAFGLSWEQFVALVEPVYGPYIALLSPLTKIRQKTDSVEPQHEVTLKNVYDLAQASKPLEDMEPAPDISPIPVLTQDLYPGTELFRVRGDSMSVPAGDGIDEGDIIYVDTRDVSARAGEIYLLHIPGNGVTVKRVRELGGALWLFSDNPDQEQFPPFAVDEARVVGRVHDAYRPLRQFRRRGR